MEFTSVFRDFMTVIQLHLFDAQHFYDTRRVRDSAMNRYLEEGMKLTSYDKRGRLT